jgi:tRNA (guanosine-2'-O-)-methyltransferase
MLPFFLILTNVDISNLIEYFEQFITLERNNRIEEVLSKRTNYITVVLENLYNSHNNSAVLRSCDCFGINDVHVIENRNRFVYNEEIGRGSVNWLNIHRYNQSDNTTIEAIKSIKSMGYRIVATSPHFESNSLEELKLETGPIAVFFGAEYTGLTEEVLKNCDDFIKIPLFGFTESLNVSVTAAIILYHLYIKLLHTDIAWQLNEKEKLTTKLQWLKNSIKNADLLEKEFFKRNKNEYF